jgi:phospholipid/cholesterol/gamma-HCH transport system substrate-binding protein
VQLDEIFRTFNARTREAFKVWMQATAAALRGRGPALSAAIAELDPFAEQTNRLLRVLNDQQPEVSQLIRSGGDVFHALSERTGQLRSLIQNSNTVFQTTARRNADLEQTFEILPTFQRESRATLERLNSFARNTDPLVQQLQPAAKQLSPTLVAAGKAAPDLKRFFQGLRGTINASDTGFPALRRLLGNDLTPFLARLGASVGGHDPYLAHLNSIVQVHGDYTHEITAFLGNAAAATEYGTGTASAHGRNVKALRTTSPLNPETLASFSHRLTSDRANPYFKPLGYNKVAQGLESFANTPCSAGITATLPPASQVASDPNFSSRVAGQSTGGDPTDFYNRIKRYAFSDASSTDNVPAPGCHKQGPFKSIGKFPQFTDYLHVRQEP